MSANTDDYSWGVWSDLAGGFLSQNDTLPTATGQREAFIMGDGEDPDDLTVIQHCRFHEEYPAYGCEDCDES